ncbi:MAG: hypothetical protein ACR2QB_03225 [Gammaproteobacteria bacterium]
MRQASEPLRSASLVLLGVCCLSLSACFFGGNEEVRCAKPQEYQTSESVQSLQVLPGMDAPDQSESLEIPDESEVKLYPERQPCLEKPPDYFGQPVD